MSHLKSRGSLFILAFIAVYSIGHLGVMVSKDVELKNAMFYWAGAVSLICMAFAILISVRPRAVEGHFGGLDRMYQVHKWLGITAMLCFALHFGLSFGDGGEAEAPVAGLTTADSAAPAVAAPAVAAEPEEENDGLISALGMYPMIGFFLLILLTLNRKVAYHRWIYTHQLMGVLFAAICLHAFLVLREGEEMTTTSLPGVLILLAIGAGLLAYLYKQTLYRTTQRHRFVLTQVNPLERATEVVLSPKDARFDFEPGQFAFLKIKAEGLDEYHPFTISSGAKDGDIRFTMKVLGDFTRRARDHLAPGAEALIDGPYGRFNPLKGAAAQVWIAGGIGITPFLSTLRSMEPDHGKTVDLFYCVREESEALYLDEIRAIASRVGGVKVHLLTSGAGGRLTADGVAEATDGDLTARAFYFCGPKPMLAALSKGLTSKGVSQSQFHFEEFEMR